MYNSYRINYSKYRKRPFLPNKLSFASILNLIFCELSHHSEFKCTTDSVSSHGHYVVLSGPTSVTIFVLEHWACSERDDKKTIPDCGRIPPSPAVRQIMSYWKTVCPSHRGVEAVGHELALAVRRDERNGAVVLETWQTDALMELHILQLHRLTLLPWQDAHKQKLHTRKYTKEDWEPLAPPWGNQGRHND